MKFHLMECRPKAEGLLVTPASFTMDLNWSRTALYEAGLFRLESPLFVDRRAENKNPFEFPLTFSNLSMY